MRIKGFRRTAGILAVLAALAAGIGARAEVRCDKTFSGLINGYSPQTTTGPYEIRGPWTLTLTRGGRKANFTAAVNMELSDAWVLTKGNMNFDPNARGAHTHHITLVNADVTEIANGFQITGPASFTLSGGPAPPTVTPSPVVIQVTGGSEVEFSNLAITFGLPGSNHFGSAPIPGVVRTVRDEQCREQRW